MYTYLIDQILRFRRAILLIFLALSLFAATHVPQLGFDFTPQQLFRSTSDAAAYREVFAKRYGREDNLVFVLVRAPDVYRADVIAFVRDVTLALREQAFVDSAESLATVEISREGESPGVLATRSVVPRDGPVDESVATALRELAQDEPLIEGQLVAASGEVTAILVWLDRDVQAIEKFESYLATIEDVVEARGPPADTTTELAGLPHLRTEIVESLKQQQVTFIPATAVAYLLVLLLLFRRPSGVVGPISVVGIAVLFTVTLLVWTGSSINIINNVLPTLIFVIGVSDSIHMLTRDAEETEAGKDRESAVRAMVRHTGGACLLTTATTAVGFVSLLAADTEILQNFGWQAASGVMLAFVATFFFLPPLLTYLRPVRRKPQAATDSQPLIERQLVRLGSAVLRHPYRAITSALAVAVVAAYFGSTVKIDTALLEVYEPSHPTYQKTKFLERELSGVLPVEISLESQEPGTFKDPDLYARIHEVQQFAAQQEDVLGTQSVVDFHQAARAALLADPAERRVMPESREQIEQIQLLLEGAPDAKTGVHRFVTPDFQHARILLRVADSGARAQLALAERLTEKLEEVFGETPGVTFRLTGDAYVASQALDSFIRDLFYSLLLAMVIIFAMMSFVFRSFKIGLVSMLPNLLPLLMTFGYMGLMKIDLNTTTVIIFAISLGIAVDDTIHFLARFREEQLEHHEDVRTAILNAYHGAGRAIMLTSIMLLIGLLILLGSDFVPTQHFGRLTAITILGAILGDLILLPAILYLVYRRAERRKMRAGGT